jgi:hypothetical protein
MKRIAADIFFVFAIFIFPWWLTLLFATIALFFFNDFYEILFLGFALDSLYNTATPKYHSVEFVVTLIALCIFIVVHVIKGRVRMFG